MENKNILNTKERIYSLLSKRKRFISGEEIAIQLSISRSAVWKGIMWLRRNGFIIESKRRAGYKLIAVPDRLFPFLIKEGLETNVIGTNIVYKDTINSTNEQLKLLALQKAQEGTLYITEYQTAGRGRRGRSWESPPYTNLLFSFLLRPNLEPSKAYLSTCLTSVAIRRAIKSLLGISIGIKWPNDLFYQGKKLAGMLTEFLSNGELVEYIVVGVGLNVNHAPRGLADGRVSISIADIIGRQVNRLLLLQEIIKELDIIYDKFKQGDTSFIEEWKRNSIVLGKKVEVEMDGTKVVGIVKGFDDAGSLILLTDTSTELTIAYGDVSLKSW